MVQDHVTDYGLDKCSAWTGTKTVLSGEGSAKRTPVYGAARATATGASA